MESSLNVLTLNCWGIRIPFFSSAMVSERMAAIANMVSQKDFDVVLLQEVWSSADYVTLSCKILDKLPHTHFFYSGFMGGGTCIFSRYPITETMLHNYPLNGHAHKIFHGDWYGSKGCGLAVLKVKDLTVNVYTTHMHARYSHSIEFDEYAGHRATQAFSLSQFVKHTSKACDAVILAGDFNSPPMDLAYRIIRCNAVVADAWLSKNAEGGDEGGCTCDVPANCFTKPSLKGQLPQGQRIDYVFYRANDMTDLRLDECTVLNSKVPDKPYDFSDHYGVVAKFVVKKNITARQVPDLDVGVRQSCVNELISIMDKGFSKARYTRYFYFVTMLLSLMVLILCRERYVGESGGSLHIVLEILQGVMAIMAGISFWISYVLSHVEQNAFLAQKSDLQNLQRGATLGKINKQE